MPVLAMRPVGSAISSSVTVGGGDCDVEVDEYGALRNGFESEAWRLACDLELRQWIGVLLEVGAAQDKKVRREARGSKLLICWGSTPRTTGGSDMAIEWF